MSRTAEAPPESHPEGPSAEDPQGAGRAFDPADPAENGAQPRKKIRWSFWNAPLVVLFLMVVGHAVGHMLEEYPLKLALQELVSGDASRAGRILGALFTMMTARDWLFTAFAVATLGFVWMEREGVKRFFRSMYTGSSLVMLSTLGIAIGVLVPQIDGFEDPKVSVDLEREYEKYQLYESQGYLSEEQTWDGHNQYKAFRWAEGYFIYHLLHLYGFGMPEGELPQQVRDGLERYGKRYGEEEQRNRTKRMQAAFSGQEKTEEISAWIQEHEGFLWKFFELSTILELNRAYKSSWFASLLFMLALSIGLNSLRGGPRRWLSIEKLGYNLTHIGLLTLLAGGLVSNLATDRGLLKLDLRDTRPKDEYYQHFDPRNTARMPFGVTLEHFARKEWKALEVYFEGDSFTSRVPSYTLWPGRTIDLDYVPDENDPEQLRPRLRLVVQSLHDRAVVQRPEVEESDGSEPLTPLAVVTVRSTSDGQMSQEWLSPAFPDPDFNDPARRWRLRSSFSDDPRSEFPASEGSVGRVFVSLSANDVQPFGYDLRLVGQVDVQGGYTVEVLDATSNFNLERVDGESAPRPVADPRPLEQQPLGMRAVRVLITGPDGRSEARWLIGGLDPLEQGFQDTYLFSDLVLWLAWDDWLAPGPPRYVLNWGADKQAVLLGEDGTEQAVVLGQNLPLAPPTQLAVEKLLVRPLIQKQISFKQPEAASRDDGWDPDFYSREPRGLELMAIRDPGTEHEQIVQFAGVPEGVEQVLMATDEAYSADIARAQDGSFAVKFFENTAGFPYEWRSVLRVHERDADGRWAELELGPEKTREIRVNDYFQHRGYRFFQTDARADQPFYSGIGVVYDPGIPIVLLGMYIAIAGTVVAFLVRPIVLRRRKLEKAA